jgi:hypothetical protein
VRLVGAELLPEPGLVWAEHVLDLVHDHALAAGAALVNAEILIGVELALPVEHPDLAAVVKHDAAVAFGKVLYFLNEHFRHWCFILPAFGRPLSAPSLRSARQACRSARQACQA